MTEDQTMEELNNLYNQVDELTNKLNHVQQVNTTNEEIIKLQRKTIQHLKMIADDRRVTINQMSEERWQVRKLESDRPPAIVESRNIAKRFMEGRIADMDCGEPEWLDDSYGFGL